ncbi:MAG: PBP1A family penicillin-binding protein [Clostridia bacterium]|nr:PBP1A family penicillin-binding protein [Clostridia bacterium]
MSNEDKERVQYSSNRNRKKKKKSHKVAKFFFLAIFWGILIAVGLSVGVVYSLFKGAGDLPLEQFEIDNFTTIIYDKDGNEYARLDSKENRIYVTIDEMSEYLPKAFVAIEDERFYSHKGVDLKRTGAAIATFLTHRGNSDFGGSTITQQLIKKVTSDDSRSWQRKVREIVRAIQVEQKMSKDQIIELYMNIIFLGENSYGVETAAHTYFNKTAKELDIAECAMIGGLAQAPSSVNPFSNYEAAKERQELVLGKMHELGFITQEQYNQAKEEELVVSKGGVSSGKSNSYFVDAVVEAVINDLANDMGIDKGEAQRMVYSKGYNIYTTVDPKIQNIMETVYKDPSYFKLSNGNYDENLQSAMVLVDYTKGNVVGLVGGAGEKNTLRGLNRATQSYRQPGSTMKPMGVYAPGLEKGTITAASTYDDALTTFRVGSSTWTPKNSDGAYRGMTSIRKAIASSINVVASKTFFDVGAAASRNFLLKLGITSLTSSDLYPAALALGGLTQGVSPFEHAGAYSTFANGGIYIEPKLYTKVVSRNGETILEKISEVRQVMSKQNAYILTDMMRDGVKSGTGTEAKLSTNMPVAGKTGTTNDSKDRWFAGYTPYYEGSVWVGYDIQKTINVYGNPAARIWKAVMSQVHEGLEVKEFEKPTGIVTAAVCADSGMLATDLCKKDRRGSRVKSEIFASGTVPTKHCTMHVEAEVCPDTLKLMNPTCYKVTRAYTTVFIDKGDKGTPNTKPGDYDAMLPTEYCTFHEAVRDENGNWLITDPIVDNEIDNINHGTDEDNSEDNSSKSDKTEENTNSTSNDDKEPYNYLDVNGVPNWINNNKR